MEKWFLAQRSFNDKICIILNSILLSLTEDSDFWTLSESFYVWPGKNFQWFSIITFSIASLMQFWTCSRHVRRWWQNKSFKKSLKKFQFKSSMFKIIFKKYIHDKTYLEEHNLKMDVTSKFMWKLFKTKVSR